jgi:hypothetical protein
MNRNLDVEKTPDRYYELPRGPGVNSKQRWASKKSFERHLHTSKQYHSDLFPVASDLSVSSIPGLRNPVVDYYSKDGC